MKKNLFLPILGILFQFMFLQVNAENLIVNGDFEQGNTGFTNQLGVNTTCGTGYYVGTNSTQKCSTWPAFGDLWGNGKCLFVKGVYNTYFDKQFVWFANSNVNAGTIYKFSFYARRPSNSTAVPLEIQINTLNNFYVMDVNVTSGTTWGYYEVSWNSNSFSGGITVGIRQKVAGADQEFAIDNILFERVPMDPIPATTSAIPYGNYKFNKCNIGYYFLNHTSDMSVAAQKAAVANALNIWSSIAQVSFYEASSAAAADIRIAFDIINFAGPKGELAGVSSNGNVYTITFDDWETWVDQHNLTATSPNTDIITVTLHEMGHIFGLGHSYLPSNVMYDTYRGSFRTPSSADIAAIQSLYHVNGASALCNGSTGFSVMNPGNLPVTWSVSGGGLSIVSGQGSPAITVQKIGSSATNQVCATINGCAHCKTVSTACKMASDNTTDIETMKGNLQTLVYPNPASQTVAVELKNDATANAKVTVYDISGKEVVASSSVVRNSNICTFNVSNLDNGVYFIHIASDEVVERKRIVVNH